jgi:glycosyltransferase involved in cell wall biosynthesis
MWGRMKVINVGVYPPPYGGVSVHLQRLLAYLKAHGQDSLIIDISSSPKDQPGVINYEWRAAIWFLLTSARRSIIHFHNFSVKNTFFFFLISFRHKTMLSFHNERFISELNSHHPFWKSLAIFFLGRVDCFVVDNRHCKELANSILKNEQRIAIIPEFIPPLNIPPLDQAAVVRLRENCKYLLSSNAFQITFHNNQDLYGLDLLVELVNRLVNHDHLDVGMAFLLPNIGNMAYYEEINRRIAQAGLTQRFCFITTPVEEAVSVWQASDIVLRATLTDGNSLTVLESLSIKVPVIASDCSERPEGTILFKTGDVDDLCEKVRLVLSDLDFYRTRLENFMAGDNAADLLMVYAKIQSAVS